MARTTAKHPARTISPQHPDSVVLQGRSQQGAELGPEPGLPHTRPSSFEQCPPSPANQYSCPTPIQVPSLPLSPLVPGLYHLTSQLLNAFYFLACKSVLPAPTLLTTGQAKLKKAPLITTSGKSANTSSLACWLGAPAGLPLSLCSYPCTEGYATGVAVGDHMRPVGGEGSSTPSTRQDSMGVIIETWDI